MACFNVMIFSFWNLLAVTLSLLYKKIVRNGRLGLVKILGIWISHELKEIHFKKRINACDLHLKRNEFDPFLKRIITGNEKWIVYNNVVRKRSWSKRDEPPQTTSKAELHQKKIMLRHNTSLATRQKLLGLAWEVMLHPPYSPDLVPSDYY